MKASNIQKNNKLALPKPINNTCDAVEKDEKVSFISGGYLFVLVCRKSYLPLCFCAFAQFT